MTRGLPVKTRAGCTVSVERVGASVGVTIVQADGSRALFACGADEAAAVADLLRAEPDRELLREVVCAAIATPPPTSADAIIDAVLAARGGR